MEHLKIKAIRVDRPSNMEQGDSDRIERFMGRWIGKYAKFDTLKTIRRSLKKELGWFSYRVEFCEFNCTMGYLVLKVTKINP